jgi:hypothetical protein
VEMSGSRNLGVKIINIKLWGSRTLSTKITNVKMWGSRNPKREKLLIRTASIQHDPGTVQSTQPLCLRTNIMSLSCLITGVVNVLIASLFTTC